MKDIFSKLVFYILKNYFSLTMINHFTWKNDEKLFISLPDKTEYVSYIRNVKQAISHRLVLKKTHRVIKFN